MAWSTLKTIGGKHSFLLHLEIKSKTIFQQQPATLQTSLGLSYME